jgi:hypothetical protein
MWCHRSSLVTPRAPAGVATRRAVAFCAVGSSKGSSVVPATTIALLLPTAQNPYGAGASTLENQAPATLTSADKAAMLIPK